MSAVPSTQISVFVNAGAKSVVLTPCDKANTTDIRVNVPTGGAPWVATRVLGKTVADAQGAPNVVRWNVDLASCRPHTTEDGREMLILDLTAPEAFRAWAREMKDLARPKGTPSPEFAAVLADLDTEFGYEAPAVVAAAPAGEEEPI